jgi:hypothetical protein
MQYRIGDLVTCSERRGIGRIERVRVAAGLCRVRWTNNVTCWHPDEDLQPADGKAPRHSSLWFNPAPPTPERCERDAIAQAVRDRDLMSADRRT